MTAGRVLIGRLAFDALTFNGAVEHLITVARERRTAYAVTPNVDHVVRAERDEEFRRVANAADCVLADGMPVIWASRLLRSPLPEKLSGSDLMPALAARAAELGLSIYLFGGLAGEAERAAKTLKARHPGLKVAGFFSPPVGFEKDEALSRSMIADINAARPDFLFVGVGSPKQELWIARWRPELKVGVAMGIGITIAFLAGTVKRAPLFMQNIGAEWLFRLAQEPRRLLPRYAKDVVFLLIILRQRFGAARVLDR